ncbi:hypothetical protein SY83_12785 [Paenibacillus swuensis]|uniref:ABC transporter substrate-binding protein n=1 Tax=Paenibacillus swuensis TaxID=1178515 RepID=A0A172TJC2_9BACL|nr:hypothetical protein [Paenibacillus swuensis]ANE47004.1 hypothetical protein SY83_12785 [Paenibacillus swuensis]
MLRKLAVVSLLASVVFVSACANSGNTNVEGQNIQNKTTNKVEEEKMDPYAPYTETITYTAARGVDQNPNFPDGQSWEKNDYQDFIEKQLNIKGKLLWTAPSDNEQYSKKLSLNIASNDLPDLFVLTGQQSYSLMRKLVDNGQIEDLTDVVEAYMSPTVKEIYKATENKAFDPVTFDGKIMGLPGVAESPHADYVWIREDWRKKLNLPEPTTVESLRQVSKAFAEMDPDGNKKKDTIGLAAQTEFASCAANMHTLDPLFYVNNAFPVCWQKDAEGKISWGGIQPENKAVLQLLRDMYKNGELDPEFGLKDNGKTAQETGSGKIGMVFQPWWAPFYPLGTTLKTFPDDPNVEWKAYVLPDQDGKVVATTAGYSSDTFLVVRKGYEHPELAVKMLNYMTDWGLHKYPEIEELNQVKFKGRQSAGSQYVGLGINYPDTVFKQLRSVEEVLKGSAEATALTPADADLYKQLKDPKATPDNRISTAAYLNGLKLDAESDMKVVVNAYTGQTETMATKWTTLLDTQKQAYLKIILGKEPVESFDTFVEQWKQLGGDQITQEVQEAVEKLPK